MALRLLRLDRLAAAGHILLERYQVDPNIISSLELGRGPIQMRACTDGHPVKQLANGSRRDLCTKPRKRICVCGVFGSNAVDQYAFKTRKNCPPLVEPYYQFDDFVFLKNSRARREIQIRCECSRAGMRRACDEHSHQEKNPEPTLCRCDDCCEMPSVFETRDRDRRAVRYICHRRHDLYRRVIAFMARPTGRISV